MGKKKWIPGCINIDKIYINLAESYISWTSKIYDKLNMYRFVQLIESIHILNYDIKNSCLYDVDYSEIISINIIVSNISTADMYYMLENESDFKELKYSLKRVNDRVLLCIVKDLINLKILDECRAEIMPFLPIGDLCDICVDFIGNVD